LYEEPNYHGENHSNSVTQDIEKIECPLGGQELQQFQAEGVEEDQGGGREDEARTVVLFRQGLEQEEGEEEEDGGVEEVVEAESVLGQLDLLRQLVGNEIGDEEHDAEQGEQKRILFATHCHFGRTGFGRTGLGIWDSGLVKENTKNKPLKDCIT